MTPARLAQITADLGERGRFSRKDPALLATARELLGEVHRLVLHLEGGEPTEEAPGVAGDAGVLDDEDTWDTWGEE